MRDLVVLLIFFGVLPYALVRPAWGVLLWTWVGLMNPHRLGWGIAYDFPFAMVAGGATLFAMLVSRERHRFPLSAPVVILLLFIAWFCITTVLAIDRSISIPALERTLKIELIILVSLYVLQGRDRIQALVWVSTFSIAFFGIKGGVYTLVGGGRGMVLGPPNSAIEGNTEIALALTMTVPLLRYLQLQAKSRAVRWGLGAAMVLCAFSILGSYSRGAFLAIAAMLFWFWLKNRNKGWLALLIIVSALPALQFMPDAWHARMSTIGEYQADTSAMGRVNAWRFALNLAADHPIFGGGFRCFTPENFLVWAPVATDFHDAHSIWFEVLAEHGYVGLTLYVLLGCATWLSASRVISLAKQHAGLDWAADLVRMVQVSLVGFWVGGSFLGLAYWDYPYVLMAMVVLVRATVERQIAQGAGALGEQAPPVTLAPGEFGATRSNA
jgi:putative inorganic carbon (HCO3(-)) transporter